MHARPLLGAAVGGSALAAGWYLDVRRRDQKARRVHRAMVQLLLNALSAGDPATERHSRRVADLTDALADTIRLSRFERAELRVAALLHDMGKLDDEVFTLVHSSGPLTPEERKVVEEHPQDGAFILEPLDRIYPGISCIVESHHEWWNGCGYPRGLKGEEIPLAARIIAVADVFDALTEPRSYKEPYSVDRALDEIRKHAGTHFDPAVVAKLDRPDVLQEWREIAREGRKEEKAAR